MIRPIDFDKDKSSLLRVIREAFLTVAKGFNLTEENAPTNPAFMSMEKLEQSIKNNVEYFVSEEDGQIVGCAAIQIGKDPGEYYLERLAVLPEYRHKGLGRDLMLRAFKAVKEKGGKTVGIGIVDENKVLKDWYIKNGFKERSLKKFDHLPFTVCFLGRKV